jgi:alpha-amylase
MRSICFYFQVHQPYRLKTYRFFEMGHDHHYYNDFENKHILNRIARNNYLPMNELLLELIREHGEDFKVAFSISGSALEQFDEYAPEVLESFQQLSATGNVEFLAETYSHSLSSLKSPDEFRNQVELHSRKVEELFGKKPTAFRNTELIYSDAIGEMVYNLGFKTMLTEGAKHILGWKSPNFMYCNARNPQLKLLLKNFKLSDDIAFRFSHQGWEEWPLSAEKFAKWLGEIDVEEETVNLFMDYETFGEHQWKETGIFDFMRDLPGIVLKKTSFKFRTPTDVAEMLKPVSAIHVPHPISWADEERDLTAWLGNEMQDEAFGKLYSLESKVNRCRDSAILADWRRLQNSDHFYYMCTKWFSDGDVHKYFNPYNSPYEAFINYMNVLSDFTIRVEEACAESGAGKIFEKAGELGREVKKLTGKKVKDSTEKVKQKISERREHTPSFEEIREMSNARIKQLLREVDTENLAYALRDAGEDIRERVVPNMTKAARKEYDRILSNVKKVKKEDIARSRDRIAEKMQKLFSKGK